MYIRVVVRWNLPNDKLCLILRTNDGPRMVVSDDRIQQSTGLGVSEIMCKDETTNHHDPKPIRMSSKTTSFGVP